VEVRASVLTCKSLVQAGFSGERPIEPPGSWFLPKSSSEELKPTAFRQAGEDIFPLLQKGYPRPSCVRMAACKANDQSALGGIPGVDGEIPDLVSGISSSLEGQPRGLRP